MKSRLLNIVKFLIGWPLSFVALYFIYTTFSSQITDISILTHMQYWSLGVGLVFFILYYFVRSYLWLRLLTFQGHTIPFRDSNFLWLFAQLKRYIPGNIWSYVGLAVTYTERKVTKKEIAYAVLIESELVIIATFILALLALPFVLTHFISVPFSSTLMTQLLTVVFLGGAAVYLFIGKWLEKGKGRLFTIARHTFSKFTPLQNAELLLLMLLTYVIYGLGYYFTIASIAPLNPQNILIYIGIFIFSLVAGYLSFITPTGLGVREGFITVGLSKFMPLGIAGFAAIFSRICIVIAELIALALSYVWYKAGKRTARYEKWVASNMTEILLIAGVIIYSIYFSAASFLRYTEYYTGRFDLGNMAQTVWNTSQGRIFLLSDPNGTLPVSRLAFHADFILIFLSPLYWIWADPRMLLFLQTVILASGAFFVYGIARHVLKDKMLACCLAFSYLLNPSIQWSNLYDFHAVVLATTFLLGAVFFMLKKRYAWFLFFAILAALTKEQLWFIVALFGPILFFLHKKKLFGATLFFSSLVLFYYIIWHAIPDAAGSSHFALSYFSEGGDSPTDIIKHILLQPGDSIMTAVSSNRIDYYQKLLQPVGYLPLFYPFWLLMALPDLVLNIFSDRVQLQQIYYQYTATISTFLFVSAIYGVAVVRKYIPGLPAVAIAGYIIGMAIVGAYLYGPLPGSKTPAIEMFIKPQIEREAIDQELAAIPGDKSISASNNLASHLSERERIYVVPRGLHQADYVAIYIQPSNTNSADLEALADISDNPFYEQYFENSQIILFRRVYQRSSEN